MTRSLREGCAASTILKLSIPKCATPEQAEDLIVRFGNSEALSV